MTTVRENLIAAKALIDTPEKWTRGEYVGDGCYCVYGAVGTVLGVRHMAYAEDGAEAGALEAALPALSLGGVVDFNDNPSTTHADIMALFDRAIASLPLNAEGGDK